MKKVLLLAAVVSFAMISCKKDYTCTCTTTDTAPGSTSETSKTTIKKATKRQAKANCFSYSFDYTSNGSTYTQSSECSY